MAEGTFESVVQVNGKVRGKFQLPVGSSEAEAKQSALNDPNVKKWIDGKTIDQVRYVPGRLLNIVVK